MTIDEIENALRERDVCTIHFWMLGTSFDGYTGAPFNVTLKVRSCPLEFMGETLAEAVADIDDWKAGRPRKRALEDSP